MYCYRDYFSIEYKNSEFLKAKECAANFGEFYAKKNTLYRVEF